MNKVWVLMQLDWDEQRPIGVYAQKEDAEHRAKRLEAEQPPRTTPYADGVIRYAYRVEEVDFHD